MKKTKISKLKIIAMIPARKGSQRLKWKNLALLDGKPLISYAIEAAQKSKMFSKIIVNSEDKVFKEIARKYGVEFYHRSFHLASSAAKSDEVVYDFLKHNPCDILTWVNPTSPLQPAEEIQDVLYYFQKNNLDTLITVKNEQVHCIFENKPINFDIKEQFSQTQNLVPIQSFVYSLMVWKADCFKQTYEKQGYAFFCGKTGFYPVSRLSSVIIKREEDLHFAQAILHSMNTIDQKAILYDRAISLKG